MFSNNGYDVIDQIDKTITTENTDPAAAPPEVDNQEARPKSTAAPAGREIDWRWRNYVLRSS